ATPRVRAYRLAGMAQRSVEHAVDLLDANVARHGQHVAQMLLATLAHVGVGRGDIGARRKACRAERRDAGVLEGLGECRRLKAWQVSQRDSKAFETGGRNFAE